ncbi:MAG: nickel pincer cofactor biosynthesis protein LarC [Actinomycetota bacterium]
MIIAYLDCFAGASGDMILGALIDAGADIDAIREQLSRLDLGGLELGATRVLRRGIRATLIELAGTAQPVMRSPADVPRLLEEAGLDPEVSKRARATLERLVRAEASVHGVAAEEVHFHELGGGDTIVDAVGVAAGIRSLGIERLLASPLPTGRGMVEAGHGLLPVPAPAVLALLKGAPVYGGDIEAELVTPTGAAILAEYAAAFGPMPAMRISSVGYGAGRRDLEIPNVVRIVVGEAVEEPPAASEEMAMEATIDDMNPQLYPYVMERLLEAGANDVWIVPAIGKLGRPAQVLHLLCPPALEAALRQILVTETSTLGVRTFSARKWMLEREWMEVVVGGQPIRVKVARAREAINIAPEYRDCVEAARRTGRPLKEIFQRAQASAARTLQGGAPAPTSGRGGS